MELQVCGLNGPLCVITARGSVKAVKQQITQATGIPVAEQRLLIGLCEPGDEELLPEAPASSCGITVTLVRQPQLPSPSGPEDLLAAPPEARSDRLFVLQAMRIAGMSLRYAAPSLRADREMVLAAVQQEGNSLQFAEGGLRGDREVVQAAVQQAGWALRHASPELRGDREVVLAAVQHTGWALADASRELRRDPEVVAAAACQSPLALEFALPALAMSQDGEAASTDTIFSHPRAAQRRRIVGRAPCSSQGEAGGSAALGLAGGAEPQSRGQVLAALRRCGMALWFAPPELRADREAVLVAVEASGQALQFAAAALRADRGIVLAAVRQAGWALQFASLSLQADREVVLAAVQQSGWALEFAAPILRGDRDVVAVAVRRDGLALRLAVRELHDDPELLAASLWQHSRGNSQSQRFAAGEALLPGAPLRPSSGLARQREESRAEREPPPPQCPEEGLRCARRGGRADGIDS